MLLGELFVEVHFATCRHGGFEVTAHLSVSLLKIGNELQYAVFGLSCRLFLFVPVWDRTTKINSLNLLHERANNFIVTVADWSHANKVDQDDSNDAQKPMCE